MRYKRSYFVCNIVSGPQPSVSLWIVTISAYRIVAPCILSPYPADSEVHKITLSTYTYECCGRFLTFTSAWWWIRPIPTLYTIFPLPPVSDIVKWYIHSEPKLIRTSRYAYDFSEPNYGDFITVSLRLTIYLHISHLFQSTSGRRWTMV